MAKDEQAWELKPIWKKDGKWYHTDETWGAEYGPFDTEEAAQKSMNEYVAWLNRGKINTPPPESGVYNDKPMDIPRETD